MVLRGIYTAAAGMEVRQGHLQVVANNLANLQTAGYRAQGVAYGDFAEVLLEYQRGQEQYPIGQVSLGPAAAATGSDFSQGRLQETGRNLDLALLGDGFFSLMVPDTGQLVYSRSGAFERDAAGYLVDLHGYRVMGEHGPIRLDGPDDPLIDGAGRVVQQGKEPDRLAVVSFAAPQFLVRQQDGTFASGPDAGLQPLDGARVRQGFLEEANTDLMAQMTSLLRLERGFQAGQRLLRLQDELMAREVTELGSLR